MKNPLFFQMVQYGAVGKAAVVSAKERNRKIKAKVIERTDALTLESFIGDSVEFGSLVYTDEHRGYNGYPNLITINL